MILSNCSLKNILSNANSKWRAMQGANVNIEWRTKGIYYISISLLIIVMREKEHGIMKLTRQKNDGICIM